ncbi:MAG: hypothetical protein AAFP00_11030, partial [Bacteroidota bacterium]
MAWSVKLYNLHNMVSKYHRYSAVNKHHRHGVVILHPNIKRRSRSLTSPASVTKHCYTSTNLIFVREE